MLSRIFFFVFVSFLFGMTIFSQTPPLETGVSQTLAKWRAANYSDVRYKLNLTLEKGAPLMKGDIEIRVKVTDEGAKNDLILDWRTTQFANDKDKPFADVIQVNATLMGKSGDSTKPDFDTVKEHLIIAKGFLKAGENVIKINFASPIKTSGAAITRYVDKEDGAEYVYSLFVPSDASTAFPVFDQPDLKARFTLDLTVPAKWNVVSNTRFDTYYHYGKDINGKDVSYKPQRFVFRETLPISTYLFAFAAGDFAEVSIDGSSSKAVGGSNLKTDDGLMRNSLWGNMNEGQFIYVRKSQAEKFKQQAAEVFRLNREGVKFLETYFDYKFPFPKYDLVLIPEFPFGGMEHAGATFLREDRVIFPTEPTKNDYVTRANVIFHEAAHQWFGDTVTMKWFDDLWLKEGFAEFMAYKTLAQVMPEYNAWKIFYERNKQAAYLTDSTKGTTPIYQEIPNLSAAKSAYGNIVYRKAPSFLRQAEFYLGEDKFQTAVRQFLKKHEFANAEWTDLVKEFELASKQDLKDWANVWVKQRGLPIIRVGAREISSIGVNNSSSSKTYFLEQSNNFGFDGNWSENVKVLLIFKNEPPEIVDATFYSDAAASRFYSYENNNGKITTSTNEKSGNKAHEILAIFPNYQDYGYGIFLLDERSRAYVLANIQTEKDDFLRTMMWGALWDAVRETELAPADYVELALKNLRPVSPLETQISTVPLDQWNKWNKGETDETTVQSILARISTATNYYLSDKQREELAPRLEKVLIRGMSSAETVGQQIVYFRAFVNTASTEEGERELIWLLTGATKIKNLNLKTKDKFDIVTRLLILGHKAAPKLLAELEKTETSDEAKRYAYAAKAAITTAENKQKFFSDFVNNKEISESYIETAFVPFNSTKHAELTLPFLENALKELPNLKRNRKIFFVNGWLSAFIGGQKSEQALAIVNKFLADNPNLDRDLRLKILENADGLERAVKIRQKFSAAK